MGCLLAMAAVPAAAQHHGSDAAPSPEARRFIESTVSATRPFTSRSEAIRAGYRRLGPDFPGMGEHWVHTGRIVAGTLDPSRPSVLSYVVVEDVPLLVGVAFTLPLAPDEEPPSRPFGPEVWHDHSGGVDEETLLLNHPASMHDAPGGFRLSMVHVWTDVQNPDGTLAQNNWRLPWIRLGLEPPDHPSPEAARGLSLAHGGREFYGTLVRRAAELDPGEDALLTTVLARHAAAVEERVTLARSAGTEGALDETALAAAWEAFWEEVRAGVRPETWAALEGLAGDGSDGARRPAPGSGRPRAPVAHPRAPSH
jgi:hypothetical protein